MAFLSSERIYECDDTLGIFITAPRKTTVTIMIGGRIAGGGFLFPGSVMYYAAPCIPVGTPDLSPKSNNGIFILASDSIFVDVHILSFEEGDAYAPLPISKWGTDYRLLSCLGTSRGAVIAAYDSTQLIAVHGVGITNDTFMLQHGDVQILRQFSTDVEIYLHANKPVGVLGSGIEAGANPQRYGDSSNITEQILPTSQWGTDFFAMPFDAQPDSNYPYNQNTLVHISALTNNTQVFMDTLVRTLNAGNWIELPVTGFHYITTSQPALVAMRHNSALAATNVDSSSGPGLAIVPAESQFLRDIYFISSDGTGTPKFAHYLDIIHPQKNIGNLTLDKKNIGGLPWHVIPANINYAGLRLHLSRGAHELHSTEPFCAMAYGADSAKWINPADHQIFGYDGYAYCPGVFASDTTVHLMTIAAPTLHVPICSAFADSVVTAFNSSTDTLRITNIFIGGADSAAFTLTAGKFPIIVPPFTTATIPIRYTPLRTGLSTATVSFTGAAPYQSLLSVAVYGVHDSLGFVSTQKIIDFGVVPMCHTKMLPCVLLNSGTSSITIVDSNIHRPRSSTFIIPKYNLVAFRPGDTNALNISFRPNSETVVTDTLTFIGPCDTIVVVLRGRGTNPAIAIADHDFGSTCVGDTTSGIVGLVNTSDTTITVNRFAIAPPFSVDTSILPITIAPHDTARVEIFFAPPADTNYTFAFHVYGEPCNVIATASLIGSGGATTLAIDAQDFGSVCPGNSILQYFLITNPASSAVTLTSATSPQPYFFDPAQFPIVFPPHTSKLVYVYFTPQTTGTFTQTMKFFGTPCSASAQVVLTGAGGPTSLIGADVDAGLLCAGDTSWRTFSLRNPSNADISIHTATVDPPFVIDSPAVPFTVPKYDSIVVRVRFAPQSDGAFSTALTFLAQPCDATSSLQIHGRRGSPAIAIDSADFGTTCIGDSIAHTLVIRNTGSLAVRIDSLTLSNNFHLQSSLPDSIAAGDSAQVTISFTPQTSEIISPNIFLHASPCGAIAQSTISGAGVAPLLTITGNNFGAVQIGDTANNFITILNSGGETILIDTVVIANCAACPFTIANASLIVLAPGKSQLIAVRYIPATSNGDTARLCIVTRTPCADSVCGELTGGGVFTLLPPVALCIPSMRQSVAENQITFPVEMTNDLPSKPDSLQFDFLFDPAYVMFTGLGANSCAATITAIAPGHLRVHVLPCGQIAIGENGLVIESQWLTLISPEDTVQTTITIDSIKIFPPIASATGCAMAVTITPICGLHGVDYTGAASQLQIFPNPANARTTLVAGFSTPQQSCATLRVFDVYGRLVIDASSALQHARGDRTQIEIDLASLPSGLYECVMEHFGARLVKQLQVVR